VSAPPDRPAEAPRNHDNVGATPRPGPEEECTERPRAPRARFSDRSANDFSRWGEHPGRSTLRGVQLGSPRCGLVRERIHQADERRLVRGLVGYATSLEAMGVHATWVVC
jgi:hypothetical protein